ncbi:uncharacterized protein PHACADRAFT_204748 [Phanerochaete carnosa HHB-10118-sp]|uniref:UBC core domain-containing protein n=1 Tax=Phanerochaete carnosa (strain HHB-10118-sp) TaxID=650164 RepID=K5WQ24_PHACS|nr:uncharacterized protein PHACADRAFT_204748 [Phanerochaete carnosa HHB-10118-sp]EKM61580.1 hypothetical protein PHACADRAFT_204748 [Phanerochaete carnosa HHB-10118-sp]
MARKRRHWSVIASDGRSPKRRAQPEEVIIVDSDDDDLEAILAKIKQQEESEAQAKRLQTEWASNNQAPQAGPSRLDEPVPIADVPIAETDEALARRLQEEWAAEDVAAGQQLLGSASRAVALFEALGGLDRQYLGERAMSDSRAKVAASKRRRSAVSTVGPGGTGYATGSTGEYHGYGYAENDDHALFNPRGRGRRGRGMPPTVTEHSTRTALASHWDEILVRALKTIISLLPAPYADDAQVYDMLPHPSVTQLLQISQLPELLAGLLRNDSLTDWTARCDLYNAMLLLLRRMADCELTLEVLIGERYELASSGGLEEWMWGDGEIKWAESSDGASVKAQPLYTYFQKLTKQSEAFLAGASALLESGGEDAEIENAVQSLSLCGEFIATKDDLERAMRVLNNGPSPPTNNGKNKGKGHDPALELERRYTAECERLAFAHVAFPQAPDGCYATFNYANQLQRTANATRTPKDRLHLVKELAVTATSLPTGIWVRVDEVRNDAIKIMIAGPEGTPYAGGLFEFDCFVPLEYPHKPPLMHLRTTGGGSVRFNPNLYNCGKVCLSLLGTWPGRPEEQWSSKSTLLQILVSIQSMILVELPWFNEPGRGKASLTNRASIEHNKELQTHTLRWAINNWLRDEHKESIWADVIASHFITREAKIRQCIRDWAGSNPRIRGYSSTPSQLPYAVQDLWGAAPAAPARKAQRKDLIAEFEQGMQRVRAWNV